ncbi:MAG: hypothetical protein R3Y23_00465 [Bacillota bacterium]
MQKAQSINSYMADSNSDVVQVSKGGGVPVSPIAVTQYVTPIVSVGAMAPYHLKGQPALVEPNYFDEMAEDAVSTEEVVAVECSDKIRKRGCSFSSLLAIILAIATVFALVAGKYINSIAEYCAIADGSIGYTYIESLINNITSGVVLSAENIIPLCVALIAVCSILTIIACVIKLGYKGVCIFAKITILLTLASCGVALGYAIGTGIAVDICLYVICGITFIQSVVALCVKRYKNCKKEIKA